MIGGGSASKQPDPLYVDMGLPSGRLWAKSNLDVTQPNGFAASPFQYECTFFSWGNIEGHNPLPDDEFDYNWGNANSWDDNTNSYLPDSPYGLTPGCQLHSNIDSLHDAARVKLSLPWRMPTSQDFIELFENCIFVQNDGITVIEDEVPNKIISMNNVNGLYLKSKFNGELLFIPSSGSGSEMSWVSRGNSGNYWSTTISSNKGARALTFNSVTINPNFGNYRFYGCAIRPVI